MNYEEKNLFGLINIDDRNSATLIYFIIMKLLNAFENIIYNIENPSSETLLKNSYSDPFCNTLKSKNG